MRISDWSSDVCSSDLQRRHFRAGLREAEDVVDEKQHVLAFDIAEIFGDRQARERDAGARARRLVHLAIDQRNLRTFGRRVALCVLGDNARVEEFVIELVALTRDRKSVVEGKSVAIRLARGGRSQIKHKQKTKD